MKVRFLLTWASPAGSARPGDVLDLPNAQAKQLIACKAAEPFKPEPAETDLVPPSPEPTIADFVPPSSPSATGESLDETAEDAQAAGDEAPAEVETPPSSPGSGSDSPPAAAPPVKRPPLIPPKKKP